MKFIRKTKTTVTKSGNRIRWGLFLCPFCLQLVEKQISAGKRDQSCGCYRDKLLSKANKNKESWAKGKKRTEEAKVKQSKTRKEKGLSKGKNNPMYGKGYKVKGENNPMYGKRGEETGNWNNGSSFEPYGIEFNKELKQQILKRDNYMCQFPNCTEIHGSLHVHHIDYNKKNNDPKNLIILGTSCHMKTNGKNNRKYWTEFYQNIMINRIVECSL